MSAVGVVGGGLFGRALAQAAARNGHSVVLYTRGREAPRAFEAEGEAEIFGDERVRTSNQLADLRDAGLIFLAVPSAYLPELAFELGKHLDGRHLLVHVSRGLVGQELLTLTRLLRQRTPCRRVGALAGPLSAAALAEDVPAGAIVGTPFPEVCASVREAIASSSLLLYESADVIGVEVASAMVGLLSLAVGYARGLGVGPAPLALVLTRGMIEGARIGGPLGAQSETFYGLSGMGDLLAAVAGDERPEVALGEALARGQTLDEAVRGVGGHIESVRLAKRVADFARRVGERAPIAGVVAAVLEGELSGEEAIAALMARPGGRE